MGIEGFLSRAGRLLLLCSTVVSAAAVAKRQSTPYSTGVVRPYTFNVTRQVLAPDGVSRPFIVVNGQFPGPTIEANYGDTFQITVNNQITGPEEGTALHWHGLLQYGTPWMDGAPGIHTCPIAPNQSFTYTFLADQNGTSWYHSHYDVQTSDGLLGAMVIHGGNNYSDTQYDIELPPIILNLQYHKTYMDIVETEVEHVPLIIPVSDNNLINGLMPYNCSLPIPSGSTCTSNVKYASYNFTSGKTHLIRLINAGADGTQHFTIDGHTMTVIANDFTPVVPYNATFITLASGQRTDILVKGIGKPTDTYWMRSNTSDVCDPIGGQTNSRAIIRYQQASPNSVPTSTPVQYNVATCNNDNLALTVPRVPSVPPTNPATTNTINITIFTNSSGHFQYNTSRNGMKSSTFWTDYNDPILLEAQAGKTVFEPERITYNYGSNSSIRLVIYNYSPSPHPMHLHGHDPWVLAEGVGLWDGKIVNPNNPQRRDTQIVRTGNSTTPGYIVFEFNADNPGVWPLHCHIGWHMAWGFFFNVLERPADVQNLKTPASVTTMCNQWWAWTGHHVVDQIDSGE